MTMVKVLIADDSVTARELMKLMIATASDLSIVGEATNGQQAVNLTRELKPDVILMDIVMPKMDGLEATREIMYATPTPIVMISARPDQQETNVAFQAIRSGALTILEKPVGPKHADWAAQSTALVNTLRAMAGVKVIHHHRQQTATNHRVIEQAPVPNGSKPPEIIAIASSTGGPAALSEIFRGLPADFDLPIVVVQHISPEFLPSLVEWLNTTTPLRISIAQAGEQPQPGSIYFAPGDVHLRVGKNHRFEWEKALGKAKYMPSGDVLFESVAAGYGPRAVGIILTGMGNDGVRGLRLMRDAGALTIAQDKETSVVYGMPQEAILWGAACDVRPIHQIAAVLTPLGSRAKGAQAC